MIHHQRETATIVVIVCLVTIGPIVGVVGAAGSTGDAGDPTLDDTDVEVLALSIDEPSDDEAAADETVDAGSVDNEVTDDEIAEEEAVDDETADDEATDDETAEEVAVDDETADDEAEVATTADGDSDGAATTDDDAADSNDENTTIAADESTSTDETTTVDPVDDIEDDEVDDAVSGDVNNAEETVEDGANESEDAVESPTADQNVSLEADQIERNETDETLDEANESEETVDEVLDEVNDSEEIVDEVLDEATVSEELIDVAFEEDVNVSEEVVDALEAGENETLENLELPEGEENETDEAVDTLDAELNESEAESITLGEDLESDGLDASLEALANDSVLANESLDDGTNVPDETNVSEAIEDVVTDLVKTVRITDQNGTVIERSDDRELTDTIEDELDNTTETVNATLESSAVDETTQPISEALYSLDEIELSNELEESSIAVNADTDDRTLSVSTAFESQLAGSGTLDAETLDDEDGLGGTVTLDAETLDADGSLDATVAGTTINGDESGVLTASITVGDRLSNDGQDDITVSLDESSASSGDVPVVLTTDSTAIPVSHGVVSDGDAGGFTDPIDVNAPIAVHEGISGTDPPTESPAVDPQAEPATEETVAVPDAVPGVGPSDDDAPVPDSQPEAGGGGLPIPDESTGAGIVVAAVGVGFVARQFAKGSTAAVAADPSTVRLQARTVRETIRLQTRSYWETIRLEVHSLWEAIRLRVRSLVSSIAALASRLLWIAPIPGYSRYDDTDPLENGRRNRLYEAISREPGVNLTRLAGVTDISRSSSRHHLRILEYENVVVSAKVYGRRRFYPAGTVDVELAAVMAEESTRRVVEALADHGPANVSTLADILDRDPSTVTHHLKRLEEAGAIERERDGKAITNRLTDRVDVLLAARRSPGADQLTTEHVAD